MKTLVILAHPDIENSRVNKRWREELKKYPEDIEIHEIYKEYPDGNISAEKEQILMEAHDFVVFQFPVYWYSYPPLLKKWLDTVFTHGWAYGSQGHALEGKTFGLALSVGDKKENYTPTGTVKFTVDEIMIPFKASANHVGAKVLPYFAVFGSSFQATDEDINQSARDYIEYIFKYQKREV